MVSAQVADLGGQLLAKIEESVPLVWRHYRACNIRVWKDGVFVDVQRRVIVPAISFRFLDEKMQIAEKLKSAVETYVELVKWRMVGRQRENLPGVNWVICPAMLCEKMAGDLLRLSVGVK